MSLTVKNIGPIDTVGGRRDTKGPDETHGEIGTVVVYFENKPYVFGPNQSISFADDGIGQAVAAMDARLRVCDDRDGMPWIFNSAPSIPTTQW